HQRLPELAPQRIRDRARRRVGRAAGGERHHDGDRPRRIVLRRCRGRHQGERHSGSDPGTAMQPHGILLMHFDALNIRAMTGTGERLFSRSEGSRMQAMAALLDPQAIAVVGASQRASRGTSILVNLQNAGFTGGLYAVNPRYSEVNGAPCVPSVRELPAEVDCIAVAVAADPACEVLEQAYAHAIPTAVVMAAGFGDGGKSEPRSARLRALAQQGMCICGQNCVGFVNARTGAAAFSGIIPKTLVPGPVALVSQSGSLGNFVFGPLMRDRG